MNPEQIDSLLLCVKVLTGAICALVVIKWTKDD